MTLYDGIPCISKWMEIENKSGMGITLDEFTLEQLAMADRNHRWRPKGRSSS